MIAVTHTRRVHVLNHFGSTCTCTSKIDRQCLCVDGLEPCRAISHIMGKMTLSRKMTSIIDVIFSHRRFQINCKLIYVYTIYIKHGGLPEKCTAVMNQSSLSVHQVTCSIAAPKPLSNGGRPWPAK